MRINRIELRNFRNHQHVVLDEINNVVIIIGNNAAGKTNIIEALQLISMHESFRKPKPEELFYRQKEEGSPTFVSVDIYTLDSKTTKQVYFTDTSRVFFYNKKERPSRELVDLLPAVLFTPDDLQIIKGPPEQRRDMLDSLGARLSKSFAQIRVDYYKALRHKNSLLRQDEVDVDLLDSWNTNLAKLGTSLSKHRRGLFDQLLLTASPLYNQISGGEDLVGEYVSSWDKTQEETKEEERPHKKELQEEKDLYEVLLLKREAETAARRALVGPHRDDILFTINGHDTRRFASQGQQRSIALALKMAEIEILRRVSGKDPLLLLDDVMSELDTTRRKYFLELISEASQTFITTTNLGYFDEETLKHATVVELKENNKDRGEERDN